MLVGAGAFDVSRGNSITAADVRPESSRTGEARADGIFGEAGALAGRCDRHLVVDDGAGQLLVEELSHRRQDRPKVS